MSKHILVVVCHGLNSSSRNDTLVAIVTGLKKNGFGVHTFDFSENLGGFDVESQVHDIGAIVQKQTGYDHIVLLAASFAALPAAIAAQNIPQVDGLITLNGFFGRAALGDPYRNQYLKFRAAAPLIPKYGRILRFFKRALHPEAIQVPVLTIHSQADQQVYIKQSKKFWEQLNTNKKFVELDSANHGVSDPEDRTLVIAEITDWLHQTF